MEPIIYVGVQIAVVIGARQLLKHVRAKSQLEVGIVVALVGLLTALSTWGLIGFFGAPAILMSAMIVPVLFKNRSKNG